jgi:hypothetical protein
MILPGIIRLESIGKYYLDNKMGAYTTKKERLRACSIHFGRAINEQMKTKEADRNGGGRRAEKKEKRTKRIRFHSQRDSIGSCVRQSIKPSKW